GRQDGDCIRSMYHGLKFGADGQCVEAPGLPRIPSKAKVRSYPVVEKNRWIWIWMGDPEKAAIDLIPDTYPLEHPDWAFKPGYLHYKANYQLITDNLLDFSHLAFVHPTTLGGSADIPYVQPEIKRLENGVHVARWHLDEVPAPFHVHAGKLSGKVDRWYIYDFLVPGLFLMHSGVQAAGTGAPEGKIKDALEFRSCHAITPETDTTSHYFWGVPHNFSIEDRRVTESVYQSAAKAFNEDRVMIEAQQRVLLDSPDASMMDFGMDAALVQFRKLMSGLIEQERQ
ncbi:MAG: aromatic ring-hydroxylating dioxygenase subunit alpha, partial [Pigmentiphaga sp.]